jgi:hypothetical protein
MSNKLQDSDWESLLPRIKSGNCTPFIGAGACEGYFPLGADIARAWAKKWDYPLQDCSDLVHVAQYLAVRRDYMFPKERLIELFQAVIEKKGLPDLTSSNEPHSVLSRLPFPIYITTNYDDLLQRALKVRNKLPIQELCSWNDAVERFRRQRDTEDSVKPSKESPVVFHLHGSLGFSESLVLTEDDYINFLVKLSHEGMDGLPSHIRIALAKSSLLFVGYRLTDWSFRTIFHSLVSVAQQSSYSRTHISVQLLPEENGSQEKQKRIEEYFNQYFAKLNIRVYWGTARAFMKELNDRWEQYNHANY